MSEINYNPFDFDIDLEAHEVWRRMRDEAPLYRNDEHDLSGLEARIEEICDDLLEPLADSSAFDFVERFAAEHPEQRAQMAADLSLVPGHRPNRVGPYLHGAGLQVSSSNSLINETRLS